MEEEGGRLFQEMPESPDLFSVGFLTSPAARRLLLVAGTPPRLFVSPNHPDNRTPN